MPLSILFDDPAPLREWIRNGASIPGLPPFTHYGCGERPRRSVRNEISNRQAFASYLDQGGTELCADWGRLDVLGINWQPAKITFWE